MSRSFAPLCILLLATACAGADDSVDEAQEANEADLSGFPSHFTCKIGDVTYARHDAEGVNWDFNSDVHEQRDFAGTSIEVSLGATTAELNKKRRESAHDIMKLRRDLVGTQITTRFLDRNGKVLGRGSSKLFQGSYGMPFQLTGLNVVGFGQEAGLHAPALTFSELHSPAGWTLQLGVRYGVVMASQAELAGNPKGLHHVEFNCK
jgi:hypothetical protein